MNRFMVLLGFGSLLLPFPAVMAEMPRAIGTTSSSTTPSIVWHETLDSGWKESRRRNVPMVIYITTEQCHYCDAMKRDTWCEASVRQRIAQGFVAIRLTPRRNSTTLNRIEVNGYPTTLVGVPQGKIVSHRFGYQPPAGLHGLLSEGKQRRLLGRKRPVN